MEIIFGMDQGVCESTMIIITVRFRYFCHWIFGDIFLYFLQNQTHTYLDHLKVKTNSEAKFHSSLTIGKEFPHRPPLSKSLTFGNVMIFSKEVCRTQQLAANFQGQCHSLTWTWSEAAAVTHKISRQTILLHGYAKLIITSHHYILPSATVSTFY